METRNYLGEASVTRLGNFLNVLAKNILTKSSTNKLKTFWAYFIFVVVLAITTTKKNKLKTFWAIMKNGNFEVKLQRLL